MKFIPLTNSLQEAIIDDEDYDRVIALQTDWYIMTSRGDKPQAIISTRKIGKYRIRLGRFIWNVLRDKTVEVDHIYHNIFDNRKENTRVCSKRQNIYNKDKRKDNTTGFIGVMFRRGKYHFAISKNGIRYNFGGFDSAEEASKARDAKALELHGQFANVNRQN